jgi:hypothetical protein
MTEVAGYEVRIDFTAQALEQMRNVVPLISNKPPASARASRLAAATEQWISPAAVVDLKTPKVIARWPVSPGGAPVGMREGQTDVLDADKLYPGTRSIEWVGRKLSESRRLLFHRNQAALISTTFSSLSFLMSRSGGWP